MNLDLDPFIWKIAAGCVAILAFWIRFPPNWRGMLQRLTWKSEASCTDCKTIDAAWRSLVNASVEVKDSNGVDLLNQWMAGYNTRHLEQTP